MTRRHLGAALGLGAALAIVLTSVASAKYRGTDMWANLMPAGGGGLVDRYPLSNYQLDVHVDDAVGLGGVSSGNLFAGIFQMGAAYLWFAGVLFMRLVIVVFQWAFDADIISGALGPASAVSQRYYTDFVQPFLAVAIISLGVWLGYKTIKSHERSEAGQALVRVVVLFVIAMAIVFHSQQTVGAAFAQVNNISSTLIARGGSARDVSDSIFSTFVYRPWAVLEFGGLKVCTGARRDADGYPLAATTGNPPKTCHSVLKQDADGHGDYARRFLRYAPGSDERNAEYDALRSGSAPDTPQFADATIDRTDAPAVDLMQAGGTLQRVVYVVLMLVCMVAGSLLLALISLAALFAQIVILLLVLLAAFSLLAALIPPLHDRYIGGLKLLGKMLVGKATFSLMMAVVLATSGILLTIGGQSGYFVAFGVQALLFGGVFYKRKWLLEKATSTRVAQHYAHHENHAVAGAAGAAIMSAEAISGGVGTFASTMRKGWSGGHASDTTPPDSSSPPASAGREYSPPGEPGVDYPASSREIAASLGVPSASDASMNDSEETQMPTRSFQEDLERGRAQPPAPRPRLVAAGADSDQPSEPHRSEPLRSFADELEAAHLARERPLPPDQLERARVPVREDLER